MIQIQSRLPHISLRPYVRMYFWTYDPAPEHIQRTVPNTDIGLMFYRSGPVTYSGDGSMSCCISGQRTSWQDILSDSMIENVGVQFTTLGASAFFGMPMDQIYSHTVDLIDFGDRGLLDLSSRIMDAGDYTECWNLMDTFFLERLRQNSPSLQKISSLQKSLLHIQSNISSFRVKDAAAELCICERHFRREFSNYVGMTPRDYQRVIRYHNAVANLSCSSERYPSQIVSLEDIAIDSGYYDYSHLSSEFRKISGLSPASLLEVSNCEKDRFGWRI